MPELKTKGNNGSDFSVLHALRVGVKMVLRSKSLFTAFALIS
jgi:hypothetical protein